MARAGGGGGDGWGREVVDAKKEAERPVRRLLHQSRRESMVVWAVVVMEMVPGC